MSIHEQNPERIAFLGDWHGYTQPARRILTTTKQEKATHLLHTGDFGIWNSQGTQLFLKDINLRLKSNNQILYLVDGNHEEFPYLYDPKQFPLQEDGTRRIRSNIFHLPRGFRWQWPTPDKENYVSFLALGGAYSIDRNYRRLGISYFDEEILNKQDIDKALQGGTVDVLVSHDSPADSPNPVTDDPLSQHNAARSFGHEHLANSNAHRLLLQSVTDRVDPAVIAHGHYHKYRISQHTRQATGTQVTTISLSESTDYTLKTLHVTSLQDLYNLIQSSRAVSTNQGE